MTNDQAEKLLDEAEDLLRTAWAAMLKMGLRDRGSDIGLSHEVRMFAAHFSEEGRDGPGALQIRGTGRFRTWLKAHREARTAGAAPSDESEPVFHLRSYGDVSREELERIAGVTLPLPPQEDDLDRAIAEDEMAMQEDAVNTLTEEGWTWDGDQWQRPAFGVKEIPDA